MQHAGTAIKDAREAQGLSQRQLAIRAGVNHAYLSRVESGDREPNGRWLRDVTDALGVHLGVPDRQEQQ